MCGWQRVREQLAKISGPNLWLLNHVTSPALRSTKRIVESRQTTFWVVSRLNRPISARSQGVRILHASVTILPDFGDDHALSSRNSNWLVFHVSISFCSPRFSAVQVRLASKTTSPPALSRNWDSSA